MFHRFVLWGDRPFASALCLPTAPERPERPKHAQLRHHTARCAVGVHHACTFPALPQRPPAGTTHPESLALPTSQRPSLVRPLTGTPSLLSVLAAQCPDRCGPAPPPPHPPARYSNLQGSAALAAAVIQSHIIEQRSVPERVRPVSSKLSRGVTCKPCFSERRDRQCRRPCFIGPLFFHRPRGTSPGGLSEHARVSQPSPGYGGPRRRPAGNQPASIMSTRNRPCSARLIFPNF